MGERAALSGALALTVSGPVAYRPTKRHKGLKMHEGEFFPGDPANHVMGRPEEQSAPVHGPMPPKPETNAPISIAELKRQINGRIAELKPLVAEAARLEAASKALKKI
jgi:hypothetical protein